MNFIRQWYYPEGIPESSTGRKNFFIDNLKFILITSVVLGHFALKLTYVKEIKLLLYFIYIFHMPCFIFVNGFLAKRMNAGGKLRVNKILSVLWMYLLFKLGNAVLGNLFHQNTKLNLFVESTAPWYLLALVIWYLSVPVLERIKTKYLIIGSFLIGLAAGYNNSIGQTFTLSRVFVFFPFFILGFCLSGEGLEKLLNKRLRLAAALVFLVLLGGLAFLWDQLKPFLDVVYGSSPYKKAFGSMAAYGALIRGIWYVLAAVLSAGLLLIVPRCRLFFTSYGGNTLQIYMLHVWIRNALTYAGFFAIVKTGPAYCAYLVLIGSVLLTFLLANNWLKKVYDFFQAQKLFDKLIKND